MDLTIVTPAYNEAGNLREFCAQLQPVLKGLNLFYEIILVDDGSRDGTWAEIQQLGKEQSSVRGIRLSRNFGQQIALSAGIEAAAGKAVITMDADLEHPPNQVPRMVNAWRNGAKLVLAVRKHEGGLPLVKRLGTSIFYGLFNRLSKTSIGSNVPDFRLMDRQVVNEFLRLKERDRFLRGLVNWLGFTPVTLEFSTEARRGEESRYSFHKMAHLAADAITSFTSAPLRMAFYVGIFVFLLSAAYLAYAVYIALFTSQAVRGWASLISVVLLLGGLQLVFLGVVGEYLSRVYNEVKQRPLYVVEETVNLDQ